VIGKVHVCGCAVLPTLSVSVIRHPHARRHETCGARCTTATVGRPAGRPLAVVLFVVLSSSRCSLLGLALGAESLGLIDLDLAAERVVSYRMTPVWRGARRPVAVVGRSSGFWFLAACSLEKKNPQKMEADGECHVTGRRPTVARHVSGHPGDVLRPSIVSLGHQRSPSAPWTGMHCTCGRGTQLRSHISY
jgi:hypothetical protein